MTTLELKKEILALIDKIEDEHQLAVLLDVATSLHSHPDGLWETLTSEEQNDLRDAIEECKDPKNWIPHEQVREEYKKWLSK